MRTTLQRRWWEEGTLLTTSPNHSQFYHLMREWIAQVSNHLQEINKRSIILSTSSTMYQRQLKAAWNYLATRQAPPPISTMTLSWWICLTKPASVYQAVGISHSRLKWSLALIASQKMALYLTSLRESQRWSQQGAGAHCLHLHLAITMVGSLIFFAQ